MIEACSEQHPPLQRAPFGEQEDEVLVQRVQWPFHCLMACLGGDKKRCACFEEDYGMCRCEKAEDKITVEEECELSKEN